MGECHRDAGWQHGWHGMSGGLQGCLGGRHRRGEQRIVDGGPGSPGSCGERAEIDVNESHATPRSDGSEQHGGWDGGPEHGQHPYGAGHESTAPPPAGGVAEARSDSGSSGAGPLSNSRCTTRTPATPSATA